MLAVIRIRGTVNVSPKIRKTLEVLRLYKPHHAVLVDEKTTSRKMVVLAKDYVAFGEIKPETLSELLAKRGRVAGNKKISVEKLKEIGAKDFSDLAGILMDGRKKLSEIGIKEVFRLNSPKKGFRRAGIKQAFRAGGNLGYMGGEINVLLGKMM
ncbi:MAG: 50S ribosomal protein L30 [archaeon]|nr:50S ribosomal protein L30 [archaeon]